MRLTRAILFLFFTACGVEELELPLFTDVTKSSGIEFVNKLEYTERLNPYTYRNFYNGAGVAIGDINNDGLPDIYFAGNQVDNKLFLNKGDFKFEDITESAGVACPGVWSTGVTMVDINADGLLDIYVCKSGDPDTQNRHNELFINNGNLTFTERSEEYGLDVTGLSVHAAFFDYDKDGDLDCYLLTNSIRSVGNYDLIKDQRAVEDPDNAGNKFFINHDGKFHDYTREAGIYRSKIGFGLGITLGDFNNDSWLDIFISNDFFERDYLYINNRKGGFDESLTAYFKSISMGSMGADVADLDNDGKVELLVTEMLPDSLNRRKTKALYENWDKYQMSLENGYYHQFSRNVLQKNIGDSSYVEVGRLAGISATEWSWGALLFDMNNDGMRDIFIANGIYKDLLDRDYLTYTATDENIRQMINNKEDVITTLVDKMPSSSVPNYAFENKGELNFEYASKKWGLDKPMYSNGSAYGDFDNDGDMDLVVNNVNMNSVIYRNNSDTTKYKSLTIDLKSENKNSHAVGSKIKAYMNGSIFHADNFVTRGFQSSVDTRIHIGVGQRDYIDSVIVEWPEGQSTVMRHVSTNQLVQIKKEEQNLLVLAETEDKRSLRLEKMETDSSLYHKGSNLVDFNRNRLLPMMFSNESPGLTRGDLDNDGMDEVYVGGGKDQPARIISLKGGQVTVLTPEGMDEVRRAEETKSVLFDADNDGDLDLYVSSGGRFYPKSSSALMDKLFINDGKGEFGPAPRALPFKEFMSTGAVVPFDFDNDGDNDLFVGERFHPFYYGTGGGGVLLRNDGGGTFTNVTKKNAALLEGLGMITSAVSADIDQDGWVDLLVVGDWMPITVLKNQKGNFINISNELKLENTQGWWHDVQTADLNKDGLPDFILGNHGGNTFFKKGDRMYVHDFDKNGTIEQVYCTEREGLHYPILDRDELISQLPSLKKKLVYYEDYAHKTIQQLFGEMLLEEALVYEVNELNTVLLLSSKEGYSLINLPPEAQYAPIYSLLIRDMNGDGVMDLVAGGNHFGVKPQFGRYDASLGWFFEGVLSENGGFSFKNGLNLNIEGEIRDFEYIESEGRSFLIVAKHNSEIEVYEVLY